MVDKKGDAHLSWGSDQLQCIGRKESAAVKMAATEYRYHVASTSGTNIAWNRVEIKNTTWKCVTIFGQKEDDQER